MGNRHNSVPTDVRRALPIRGHRPGQGVPGDRQRPEPRTLLWAAIRLPFTRRWLARLDDRVGNGSINPTKKWWWDLEWRDGRAIVPPKGTNARNLDPGGTKVAARQQVALYAADMLPPGDAVGVPVKLVRKEALARAEDAESPAEARARVGRR